jgi:hypothetical protein
MTSKRRGRPPIYVTDEEKEEKKRKTREKRKEYAHEYYLKHKKQLDETRKEYYKKSRIDYPYKTNGKYRSIVSDDANVAI